MLFNTVVFLAGLLSLTTATSFFELPIPTTVYSPSSTAVPPSRATASAQLASYFSVLATGAPFASALSILSTNPNASSSLSVFEASLSSVFANRETLASDYLNGIPETVRPFFSSVYAAEASILKKNGLGTPLTKETATTKSTGPAKSTGTASPDGGKTGEEGGDGGGKGSANSESKKGIASREAGLGRAELLAVIGAVGFISLIVAL